MPRITFLVHKGKEYTVQKYLASWGRSLADRVRIKHYPGLRTTGHTALKRWSQGLRAWRIGTLEDPGPTTGDRQIYVFTDIERLNPNETGQAVELWNRLEQHPDTALLLNHPVHSLRRFELLQKLYEHGVNDFSIYRASEDPEPRSWPVFLRDENEHAGRFSQLIHDRDELRRQIRNLDAASLQDQAVVEFRDTADSKGVIRKFGAFRVDGTIVARQIHFSRNWVVRVPDIREPETGKEELEYVEANPHAEKIREIFELAHIDYGRVDYSVIEGEIRVWEINTNPMILIPKDRKDPLRFAAHDLFGQRFTATLADLLSNADRVDRDAF